ncbi:hypothetical protein Tco_1570953 [Tanacetum coccineum]
MEIELPGDLKKILTKLETFTSTISSLSSHVVALKNIQWELPVEFLNLLCQVSSVQEKLKTLDSLPSLLHKVTDTLNRFATMVDNASEARSRNVPSAGKATASPTEGEKNTKDADTNLKDELVDLLGKNVVTREDGSDEVISNLKVSDLHLAKWRELNQTEQELKIDLSKPLKEQDPLNKLNELANKKMKRTRGDCWVQFLSPSVGIKRLHDDLEVTATKMIDYSLWEVIENGNAPPITKVVKGVETIIAPTTAKEKAQRRLQKLPSPLEIHGKIISQEVVNQKFLRSLSPDWNTHTIVWRNKPEIDTLSMDDLNKNLKIYELEVKGTSSSSTNTQNLAFVSANSSTNGAVNTVHGAITASTQAIAVNSTTINNLSNVVIYAFFASQPNSP